jgi:hypothetical protein
MGQLQNLKKHASVVAINRVEPLDPAPFVGAAGLANELPAPLPEAAVKRAGHLPGPHNIAVELAEVPPHRPAHLAGRLRGPRLAAFPAFPPPIVANAVHLAALNAAPVGVDPAVLEALDNAAQIQAEIERIRREAEQVENEKLRVLAEKATAHNVLADRHNILLQNYRQLEAEAQAMESSIRLELQSLSDQADVIWTQLSALAQALLDRLKAANAAVDALNTYGGQVRDGMDPTAAEAQRLRAEYNSVFDRTAAERDEIAVAHDARSDALKEYLKDEQTVLDTMVERVNERKADLRAALVTAQELETRVNALAAEVNQAIAAGDNDRAEALMAEYRPLERDYNSAVEHLQRIDRDVTALEGELDEEVQTAKAEVAAREAELGDLKAAFEAKEAELKRLTEDYPPRIQALDDKVESRYAELEQQLQSQRSAIEADYGPQASDLLELLSGLFNTQDVDAALTGLSGIPNHAAAPRLKESADSVAGIRLLDLQAAQIRVPLDAKAAELATLGAQLAEMQRQLDVSQQEFERLQGELEAFRAQVRSQIDALLGQLAPPPLQVQVSAPFTCPNDELIFEAAVPPNTSGISWSCNGDPGTGTGVAFRTRFSGLPRKEVVEARWDHFAGMARTLVAVQVRENSGPPWVQRFPGSNSPADLVPSFRAKVERFIAALQVAGASVSISATYRPLQRAYLMHYAWRVANHDIAPQAVPVFDVAALAGDDPMTDDVDICWVYRDAAGNPDLNASVAAAQQMVAGFHIVHRPAYPGTKHHLRKAIDMAISWDGDLEITGGDGVTVTISTLPRNGENADLQRVGATYGVSKLAGDPPHWFD